jgi:hypothetical protein
MSFVIHNWQNISEDFSDGLLLGNGASIAVDNGFSYTSLYEEALAKKIIKPRIKKVFDEYDVNDFEEILDAIENAKRVNSSLVIKDRKTRVAYQVVKNALIRTVQLIHPHQAAVLEKIDKGIDFLRNFSMIASLNYDLLLYWTIMQANDINPRIKFKDCFVNPSGSFRYDWKNMQAPIRGETKSILCFYPHGNIAIVKDEFNENTKIVASSSRLLSTIVNRWSSGYSPLFVSEGSTKQKLSSINESPYLNRVYNSVLPNIGDTLVVYGSSFQKNDAHIFNAILSGTVNKMAISVHKPSNPNCQIKCSEIKNMLNKIRPIHITFFDAESTGAWIY